MTYLGVNRDNWNQRTKIHYKSLFYNVDGFMDGACALRDIELSELGDVEDKRMLHLQCHFGLDTLSWARRGAIVTGVDFSDRAIDLANDLKERAGLAATFVCADIYDFGKTVRPKYDIVFTSYGAICWLPDLREWANIAAKSLRDNGTFYMVEFHPFNDVIMGYPYFHQPEPELDSGGTYTENGAGFSSESYTWAHSIGDVINALIRAGIVIEHLNEFAYSPYNCFEEMSEREPGRFYLTHHGQDLPLVYSVKGSKKRD